MAGDMVCYWLICVEKLKVYRKNFNYKNIKTQSFKPLGI